MELPSTVTSEETQPNLANADPTDDGPEMSRLETMRAELESAKAEIQCLETENTRWQEPASEARAEVEELRQNLASVETEKVGLADECGRTKTLYDGLLVEVQQEREEAAAETERLGRTVESLRSSQQELEREAGEWERRASELRAEMEALQERQELELLRAVEKEKTKWEARENRLAALMEQLQAQCSSRHLAPPQPTSATQEKTVQFSPDSYLPPVPTVSYSSPILSTTAAEVGGVLTTTTAGGTAHTTTAVGERSPIVGEGGVWEGGAGGSGEEGEDGCSHGGVRNGGVGSGGQWNPNIGVPTPTAPLMATHPPIVAQQLPPLAKFTGDSSEGETVIEWLEKFQLVANACHWDESTKLVNLVSRLKGQAFTFY